MSKSLQDQLLRAGLANKKQAVRAKKAKNHKEKLQRTGKEVIDETQEQVKAAEAAKLEKDKALNKAIELEKQTKAIEAQIKDLLAHASIMERGDTNYSYDHNGSIKSIMLEKQHRDALVRGALALVYFNEQYHLVPKTVATKIAQRDEKFILVNNANTEEDNEIDDEYADYKIPDDLMW